MIRYISLTQVMTFRGQLGVGSVNSGTYEYFAAVGFIVFPLDETPSAVQVPNVGQPGGSRLIREIAGGINILRIQTDIGKVSLCFVDYFNVFSFTSVLLDEPKSAVQYQILAT